MKMKKKREDVIICLVGCSGSGKTTVAELFENDGYKAVQSYTTRNPRYKGETGHTFVSDEEFDKLNKVLAYNEYNGFRYCTTEDQINNSDIYVVDIPGIKMLKEKYHGHKSIIVVGLVCSPKAVKARMRLRGDSDDAIQSRLDIDAEAFADLPNHCDFLCNSEKTSPIGIKRIIEQIVDVYSDGPQKALSDLKVGDTVFLGDEFIITNQSNEACTLVSKYSVKEMPYSNVSGFRWSSSSVRKYLNEQYMYKLLLYLEYSDLLGLKTQDVWDKVSILSPDKYLHYIENNILLPSCSTERFWLTDDMGQTSVCSDLPGAVIPAIRDDYKLSFGVRPIIIVKNSVEVKVVSEC